jgi:hypothetical protein
MKKEFAVFMSLAFLFAMPLSYAQDLIPPSCTTTEKIHFARSARIPPELNSERVREAVLVALGYADVDVSWARDTFAGQWFFEFQDEFAIYAGYSVRSHYLQVAVLIEQDKVTSIVCDSRNLKQSAKSIHRKVPGWKGTLDDNIRIALGQAAEYYRRQPTNEKDEAMATQLENLNSLRRSGVLTNEEYENLRQRVIDQE